MAQNDLIDDFTKNYTTFNERKDSLFDALKKENGVFNIDNRKDQITERIITLLNLFSGINSGFSSIKPALQEAINGLLHTINEEIKYFLSNATDHNTVRLIGKLVEYSSLAQAIKVNILNDSSQNIEFEGLFKRYNETIKKLEVSTNSLDFKDTVIQYKLKAKNWLKIIACLSILLFIVIVFFMYCSWFDSKIFFEFKNATLPFKNADNYFNVMLYFEILRKTLVRLLIITLIVYLLKFSINNYNAYLHNIALNQHKANILDAAVRMINITNQGDEERNSILGLASKEIFSHHSTGFIRKEEQIDFSIIEKLVSLAKRTD